MKTTMQRYRRLLGLSLLTISLGALNSLAGDVTADNVTVNKDLKVINPGAGSAPTNGLILYHSFSANTTPVPDDSGNGHTGTVSGAIWITNGVTGGAYSFDGNGDEISVPNSSQFDFGTGTFTMAAWIYPTDTTRQNTILGKSHANNYGWLWLYQGLNGHLQFLVGDGGSGWDVNWEPNTVELNMNTWNHIVLTQDSGTLYSWINGQPNGSRAGGNVIGSATSLLVGGISWVGLDFTGNMDEVRIYSRALSSNEVHGLYLYDLDLTAGSSTFETGVTCKKDVICEDGVKYLKPLGDIPMGVYTNDP